MENCERCKRLEELLRYTQDAFTWRTAQEQMKNAAGEQEETTTPTPEEDTVETETLLSARDQDGRLEWELYVETGSDVVKVRKATNIDVETEWMTPKEEE